MEHFLYHQKNHPRVFQSQNYQTSKANKKNQILNFPSIDIPDIDKEFMHDVYDPPNIDKLRKENSRLNDLVIKYRNEKNDEVGLSFIDNDLESSKFLDDKCFEDILTN